MILLGLILGITIMIFARDRKSKNQQEEFDPMNPKIEYE